MTPDFAPFVNVPYAEADCRELVRRVLEAHGLELPGGAWEGRAAGWRPVQDAQPLDVAMFNTPAGLHVGVVVARGKFLHADRELGRSCVERLGAPGWAAQLEGIYRHG